MSLKIIYKPTGDLVPYINNSRIHSEQQVQQVAASIKEFGFTNPILIDEQGGVIAGHGRLQAAQLLDLDKVPTITLNGLSEAQRKAYVIADNQLALNSELDLEKLKLEIDSLSGLEFNLDILGFDDTFMLELNFDADELDYSMLEDDEADESANEIASAGKKAIQIEFDIQDYDEAADLVRWWRERAQIGQLIIALLQKAKESNENQNT